MERNPFKLTLEKWSGQVSSTSPHVLPIGAAVAQQNLRHTKIGQADVRPGLKPVTFSNATTAVTQEVIAVYQFPASDGYYVVYEDSSGAIHTGKNPSL